MRILFDQGTPVPLRRYLTDHVVDTAYERGWSDLQNGELLDVSEHEVYEILVTTDQNLKYQQNLANSGISVIVLLSTSWPRIQEHIDEIKTAIANSVPGSYTEVSI